MAILIVSLFTACFTWCIAWAFIKILFIPKTPLPIFGIQWESALTQIVKKLPITQLIEENKTSSFSTLMPFIDQELDHFFKQRLVQKMPIVSMFIGEKTIAQLKEVFMEELNNLFPDLISQLSLSLYEQFLSNLSVKWGPILETVLLKATQKLRWAAFFIGAIWGCLICIILQHL